MCLIRHCIPGLDTQSLRATRDVLRECGHLENVTGIVDMIETRLATSEPSSVALRTPAWQRDARRCLHAIISPDDLTWMDADAESIDMFAQRAFDEIKNRFTR